MKTANLLCCILVIFCSVCLGCNKTQEPTKEIDEKPIIVKSKGLRGLSAEVNDVLSNNNYTATQKVDYRIYLTLAINKHVNNDPYECAVLLIKLTQNAGAADSESILPSLNEIFLKHPIEAVTAIKDSPNYLLKQFNNTEYIDWLYSAIISVPFYYADNASAEQRTLLLQKDKSKLKKIINDSSLDNRIKIKAINHIDEMKL